MGGRPCVLCSRWLQSACSNSRKPLSSPAPAPLRGLITPAQLTDANLIWAVLQGHNHICAGGGRPGTVRAPCPREPVACLLPRHTSPSSPSGGRAAPPAFLAMALRNTSQALPSACGLTLSRWLSGRQATTPHKSGEGLRFTFPRSDLPNGPLALCRGS